MKQLADTMAQDAYANPGLAEQFKSAAEGMNAAQSRRAPGPGSGASGQLAADAARRLEKLSQQMRQAQRMLSEGRKPEPAGFPRAIRGGCLN